MNDEIPEALVEVYRSTNDMDVDRAIVQVLQPDGIDAFRRDRVSHALPAPDSETGSYFIAVPEGQADTARSTLRQALSDQIIAGEIIEEAIA